VSKGFGESYRVHAGEGARATSCERSYTGLGFLVNWRWCQ